MFHASRFIGPFAMAATFAARLASAQVSPQVAPPPPATKLEAFKPAAGSVTTMGYDELGSVGSVRVDVREMRGGGVVRGLVVEVRESQYRDERAFVDADEVAELIKGFDAILDIKSNPTAFKSFEVHYATRGELVVGAFNGGGGRIQYVVKAGRITPASSFLDEHDMRQLRAMLAAAQERLAALPAKN